MTAETTPAWHIFKPSFAEPWAGFTRVYPRYDQRYYASRVDKRLGGGKPDPMGSSAYRCLQGGHGTHRGSMSCQSSRCLRCAKVYVAHWVRPVSPMLHDGVISRHLVLPRPAM